ncbi:sugar kinase [Sphingopyxis sp. NJF-3]
MIDPNKTIACFGEIVLRLAIPAGEQPLQSPRFDVHVGGAEANVAVALAALGHRVRMISALPEGPIGDAAIAELRRHGVDTGAILRRPGRVGLYYHLPGGPARASEVVYDRADSAFAAAEPGAWDWAALLADAGWLHLSGVTPALGQHGADAALAAARTAHAAGIGLSFDGNWRGRLWERWDGDPATILRAIIGEATLLFGNHRDAALLLGRDFSGDGGERRRDAALALLAAFPNLDLVASTARHIVGPDRHEIAARIDRRAASCQTEARVVAPIVDRIGTGDAFAAGVLHGLFTGADIEGAAQRGLALATLKHGLRGDFAPFSSAALAGATAGSSDVAR